MSLRSAPDERPDPRRSLDRDVDRYARRERSAEAFWRSLSVLGTVGWSIALPAAAGAWLGHRLDLRFDTGVRFTLMLLTAGVMIGSVVAWRVVRSHRE
jgi:ATP synthase protein I